MHAIKDMIHFDGAPPISFGKMGIGTSGWRESEEETYMGRERGHGMMIICKNRNSFEVAFMESQ